MKQGKPKPQPIVKPQRTINKKVVTATAHTRRAPGEDLPSMVMKALRLKGEMDLTDLLVEVLTLGYKTESTQLAQAIYNLLSKLKKEGKVAKNDETKTYFLIDTDL
jgi:cytochrome P450